MRIFKSRHFAKFARKAKIPDSVLQNAIEEIEKGLIDADLGSGVYKQRLPKVGRGKSKGFRSIIFYKTERFSFFIYGFDKKDLENIPNEDEAKFRTLAPIILNFTDEQIEQAIIANEFIEIDYEKNNGEAL